MSIDTTKITHLLGNQTKFVPTRTDNVHTAKKNKNKYTTLDDHQLELFLNNSDTYSNAKILANSAPPDLCWLILDYDDKKKTGKVANLQERFNLPKTFTVKTPTGAGKQEWYLIKEADAARLPNNKYIIPEFPHVEIFVGHKDSKQLFVAPGSKKKNGKYELQVETQPKEISDILFSALVIQADTHKSEMEKVLDHRQHVFNTNVDDVQNKKLYLEYINKIVMDFDLDLKEPLGDGDGRDNFLFGHICHGFTFNLSPNVVKEIVYSRLVTNENIIVDPANEYNEEYLNIKILSAYNYISDLNRKDERTTTNELAPFDRDEYGKRIVTREALTKKALHISMYDSAFIMETESLRNMLSELMVYDSRTGNYYIATILSHSEYDKLYKKSIEHERSGANTQIEIQNLLSRYSDTVLHWDLASPQRLRELYKIPGKSRNKPLINTASFLKYSFICNTYETNTNNDIIIEDNCFYPATDSPIKPLDPKEVSPKEYDKVKKLIRTHLKRIVDVDNYEEESKWLLDRFALLLQNRNTKIDNAIIFKGSQGSGKTSFIEVLMLLFPRQDTNLILDVTDLENRFTEFKRVTHIDDINLNLDKKVMNKIKAMVTTSRISYEKKFEHRALEVGTVNFSISTNDEITDREVLFGRRWTAFVNDELFVIEDVAKEVREMFQQLKDDNWRLFRVLHTYLLERDVSNFKSDYKTRAQKKLMLQSNKGTDFAVSLANMIANYGYLSPDCRPFVPNETMNRSDFVVAIKNYYFLLDSNMEKVPAIEDLNHIKGFKLNNIFNEDPTKRKRELSVFKEMFTDSNKTSPSKINNIIKNTWSNDVPPIRKWIELLTVVLMNNRSPDMIDHIVDTFNFNAQWDWDNVTKPDIENLGSINVFDHVELEDLYEEEY